MVQRVRSFPRAVLWVVFLVGLPGAGWPSQLEVAPRRVEIGAFFGGKEVVVSAEIPPLADAVVELVGEDVAETLVRKGRIGPLWMNVGEIVAQGFPTLYMVASTSSFLLAGGDGSGSWGYGKLREQARLGESGGAEESDSMLREFIKLKETQGLYKLLPVGVELVSGDERAQSIRARFPLPRCIRPGTYTVSVSAIRGGEVLQRQQTWIEVEMTGFPRLLRSLAEDYPMVYGIMAVVAAMLAGYGLGWLFGGGRGSH
jgi:hypothetical protein